MNYCSIGNIGGNLIRTYDINQFKSNLKSLANNPSLAKKFANENGFDNIDQMLKQYDLINKYIDESDSSKIIRADLSGNGRYNIFGNVIFKEGTESLIKLSMKNPAITNGDIYSGIKKGTYALDNEIQFKALWKKVYDLYKADPDALKANNKNLYDLLESQTDDIIQKMSSVNGIDDYTWHHSHIPGDFQLVKSTGMHKTYTHTGGDALWGGTNRIKDLDPNYKITNYRDILFNQEV